jgi:hypothetical protein
VNFDDTSVEIGCGRDPRDSPNLVLTTTKECLLVRLSSQVRSQERFANLGHLSESEFRNAECRSELVAVVSWRQREGAAAGDFSGMLSGAAAACADPGVEG